MGTRNITQVILGGKTLVSQYCQWDGYPEGQGASVLDFLKHMNREQFETNLQACSHPTAEEAHAMWEEAFITIEKPRMQALHAELPANEIAKLFADKLKDYRESGMVSMDVSAEFKKHHPSLTRDMGGDILQFIHDATVPVEVSLDLDFVNDSLFCEWAYVVDLDNNVFEVYEGFNADPVPADNRFQLKDGDEARETADGSKQYYPVRLIQTFDINDLPDEETFVKVCANDEDEEDDEEERSSNDVFNSVVMDLRGMATTDAPDNVMLNHMMNYIEANKDDFMEAVGN